MKKFLLMKILLLAFLFSNNVFANIKIVDGDTLKINKERIRLFGIDAPEKKQKCFINNESIHDLTNNYLENLIRNYSVICKKRSTDFYKRSISICYADEIEINKELVRRGYAFAYKKYSNKYIDDENYAKKNNLGIHSCANLEKPWEYRKNKRKRK